VCPGHINIVYVSPTEICTAKVGAAQIRVAQVGMVAESASEVTSGDLHREDNVTLEGLRR
jgi:hypothetical protein